MLAIAIIAGNGENSEANDGNSEKVDGIAIDSKQGNSTVN